MQNGLWALSFRIENSNPSPLTGLGFTDSFPSGWTLQAGALSDPASLVQNQCGGTVSAVAGGSSVTLTGGQLSASGVDPTFCTVVVSVIGTVVGVGTNSVTVTSLEGGTGNTSSNSFTVVAPPPPSVVVDVGDIYYTALNDWTMVRFRVANTTSTLMTHVGLLENLPDGLVVAQPGVVSEPASGIANSCGGTVTADPLSTSIALSQGAVQPLSTCELTVILTGTSPGNKTHSVTVFSTDGGNGNTSTTSVTVAPPPVIDVSFGGAPRLNGDTGLSVTLRNLTKTSQVGAGLTVTLPNGLEVATPSTTGNQCGGTLSAVAGSHSIGLSGQTIPAGSTCLIEAQVTATTMGLKQVSATGFSTGEGNGNTATASITPELPALPSVSSAFGAPSVALGSSTTLSFVIANANTTTMTGVEFVDQLPSGLTVATPNGLTSTCGGSLTANPGGSQISLLGGGGGTIPASSTCSISVSVSGAAVGPKTNVIRVFSSEGPGSTSTAMLTVRPVPSVSVDSGPGTAVASTNDTTPTFTYSSTEPGTTYRCAISAGGAAGELSSCPDGTFTAVSPLADGSYTFHLEGTGGDGVLISPQASVTFAVDTVAPQLALDSGPGVNASSTTNSAQPTFTYHSSESGTAFHCAIVAEAAPVDSAPMPLCPSGGFTPTSPLAAGNYAFRLQGSDPAGNAASPVERTFTFTPAVPAPTGLTLQGGLAVDRASATAALGWATSPDARVTGYAVTVSPTRPGRSVPDTVVVAAPDHGLNVSGLVKGTAYTFSLIARTADASSSATTGQLMGTTVSIAGPGTVVAGAAPPITGTLKRMPASTPWAGQPMTLFRRSGSTWASTGITRTTNSSGQVTASPAAPMTRTTYAWAYAGGPALGAVSRDLAIAVAFSVNGALNAATLRHGSTAARLYGTVNPGDHGGLITLQQNVHGVWRAVVVHGVAVTARVTLQRLPNGVTTWGYSLSVPAMAAGSYVLRAYASATSSNAAGASPPRTLRLT